MKKIFLLIYICISFIDSCQCKPKNMTVNIRYIGNYDFTMDILLTNIMNLKKRVIHQSMYEVEDKCMM